MSISESAAARPVVAVAAGCWINARGEVLIAQRPEGKIAAGQWEFPGGKIENNETPRAALVREWREELGVEVREARPLIRVTHDYSDRRVELDVWCVTSCDGAPHARENQALQWRRPQELHTVNLLAADRPVVKALCLPSHYVFTPPHIPLPSLAGKLSRLPAGCFLRIRHSADGPAIQGFADAAVREGVAAVFSAASPHRHVTAAEAAKMQSRPAAEWPQAWCGVSVHTREELATAVRLGADFAVLGPVQSTASHPGAEALGWDRWRRLREGFNLPVYAIGGLGPDDLARAWQHGAQGIAGISAYWR